MASKLTDPSDGSDGTGEVTMFATIKNLIPEPRQADQPRRYVGRHRPADLVTPSTPESGPVEAAAEAPVSVGAEPAPA
jgi:hypothetical protein